MSSKRIKYWDASRIATAIADKAFEHIFAPFDQEMSALACAAYIMLTDDLGGLDALDTMHKHGVLVKDSRAIIDVVSLSGQEETVYYEVDDATLFAPAGHNQHYRLVSSSLFDQLFNLNERMRPYERSKQELRNTLQDQLQGQTTTAALKAWPEAAQIIAKVMDLEKPKMVSPLEALLARFLPALPAPEAA